MLEVSGAESICVRYLFFFSSRRRHTRCSRDWSSDVCSSDLCVRFPISTRRFIVHSSRLTSIAVIFVALVAMLFCARISEGDEWLPVSPQELKVTGEPKAPGAPAIILYRQIDRDDSDARTPHEYNYVRTKILTEEGRKYADVEIPFFKENENVVSVRARTIRPDGSIVNFDGKVYEKEIVKARGVKFLAKTFTLSDVQPGSIIEYHYMIDFKEYYVFNSHWTLSEEL